MRNEVYTRYLCYSVGKWDGIHILSIFESEPQIPSRVNKLWHQ